MDQNKLDRLTREKVAKRFGSHEVLYSKYIPQIPASAEREYIRTTNAYMRILKEELEKELPKLKEAYKANRDADVKMRHDSATDLMLAVSQIFNSMKNAVVAKTIGFGLRRKLELLANMNRKLTVKEWKRAIKATLGIDIREDYYLGDFYVEKLKEWVEYNVSLISTIPEDTLERMREIVYDGFTDGKTTTQMLKEIQRVYGINRRHAELIARDQTAKLNGQIQKAQQQDAGINEYIWYTTGDERVRKSHDALKGKKFSWNNPPDVGHGRRCHPGEDYQCRCIGRPVFNKNTLSLPVIPDESDRSMQTMGSAKDRFGIITNNNKSSAKYYEFKGKNLKTVEAELSKRTCETAVCFDERGKAIFAQIGTEDAVEFTGVQCRLMKGKIVTHNHPLGTPPSPDDMYVLMENKAKEFRTCGKRGTYVLQYNKQPEKLPDFSEFGDSYSAFIDKHAWEYAELARQGMDEDEALVLLGEAAWKMLNEKYGVVLEFEEVGK